ncbi:50S ribosomal protein L2 [Candidatus Giovannonibacteria bacterium RIFCSPLOWO2_02_FULL_43_11b]|uniref:Large ribosomal subunit protein uL2 n=1 Tax=Candidatus Giovannonibacteria bacterium RIFCSPHIGHO2_12_FULL_43_15 TaxID=1798341 RepID=A0A1F5WS91_9BACT|nr:MAG: 50S ribosomal protein L2 [Candidatus Giovannonibacteria bacterium RIFCSPHIGHO2_01_FULL_43_100]OGF66970.1 MAG: 50S ribosomal protein L2 [Candidatus Giovannonibacteria bacterium RIFCSPHIGHO2_02_FULL_43_32]OGF78151.1 MAG: 50S ribosomal protein L2 [Candidatus Giovannonibacteria bacterium RIFCSPHIGHO2_12_FULL_43_15]OGF78558.1 MAG: 50S ribosomal protein L2 [Candidatus Giovannonibacteria bacterium RIFCSPLOWO2_01_FULL_43_60]OGF89861.1 MAG: 50S ribosomal protein L2 [Candidatus Giovannonibacteria
MKSFKPKTPSLRQTTVVDYKKVLTRGEPEKSLTHGFMRSVGRNNRGRITTRHKGGGVKRLYREIDFIMDKKNIPARVISIEYDPNRTAFIGLVSYHDGEKRYMVMPADIKLYDEIMISESAPLKMGNRLPLKNIPVGTQVYNIEVYPMSGAKLVRSAGTFAEVLAQDSPTTLIKLPSSEIRKVSENAWASIGQASNEEANLVVLGKAGRSRHLGIRPTVRGSAMNPVDHPYGGGEGRAMRGTRRPKNRWGKGVRGVKTRGKKKWSSKMIIQRRKK